VPFGKKSQPRLVHGAQAARGSPLL